jgi:DNA-binding CsgD family transcriptional regulator
MDLVEAAVRTGRGPEAAAHVAALGEAEIAALSPRLALLVGGSSAIAAGPERATDLFEAALTIPGVERWPFDLARVRLAFGGHLHRTRAVQEARVQLRGALEAFRRLGAGPWMKRADDELGATGAPSMLGENRERATLTSQERDIAELAATGLTNNEIGRRLYLSGRTVGAHLYRIYPKLGIRSRAALADALRELEASD